MNEKREQLEFVRKIAFCAERAGDTTGKDRAVRELRRCIEENEREHRAFGRRLVGNIGARMTVSQAVDYFVARTLAMAATEYKCGKAPIASLDGVREDYVRAAILMGNREFHGQFMALLGGEFPQLSAKQIFARVEACNYEALVSSGNVRKVSHAS